MPPVISSERRRLARRAVGWLAAGALAAAAGGCGFKLRESADLPFATLYSGLTPGSTLAAEFARQARRGTTLVDSPDKAEAALILVSENRDKEAVSFSRSGRPREYELRYSVQFRVVASDGSELLGPTRIALRRYLTTTDLEQLSEELEEAFLYSEMQSDMVQQILRRLSAIKPQD